MAGELLDARRRRHPLADGLDERAVRRRGRALPAHAADHRRRAAGLPLRHVHRPRKAGRASHRQRHCAARYSSLPGVRPPTWSSRARRRRWTTIVAGIERGVLVTDAVGIHSGANPISGEFSVGISGVLIENGRVHDAGARGHPGRRHRRHAHRHPRAGRRRPLGARRQHPTRRPSSSREWPSAAPEARGARDRKGRTLRSERAAAASVRSEPSASTVVEQGAKTHRSAISATACSTPATSRATSSSAPGVRSKFYLDKYLF